jgi:hypothetical protein
MVYVDDMLAPFRNMIMCHMIADTDEELHAMADRLGLARKWHQKPGTHHSHYDISIGYKSRAIKLGAIQIKRSELGAMLRHKREFGRLGTPQEALAWLRQARGLPPEPSPPHQDSLF